MKRRRQKTRLSCSRKRSDRDRNLISGRRGGLATRGCGRAGGRRAPSTRLRTVSGEAAGARWRARDARWAKAGRAEGRRRGGGRGGRRRWAKAKEAEGEGADVPRHQPEVQPVASHRRFSARWRPARASTTTGRRSCCSPSTGPLCALSCSGGACSSRSSLQARRKLSSRDRPCS